MPVISSIIKLLIDLTIIDVPRLSIHEVSSRTNTTVLRDLQGLLIVGVLDLILTVTLLAIITKFRLRNTMYNAAS